MGETEKDFLDNLYSWIMSEQEIEDYMNHLMKYTIQFLNGNFENRGLEDLYFKAYKLTLNQYGDKLHGMIKEELTNFLKTVAQPQLLDSCLAENCMPTLMKLWADYEESFEMIKDFCMFLDRYYCEKKDVDTVATTATKLFRKEMFDQVEVVDHMRSEFLRVIQRQRQGQTDVSDAHFKDFFNILEKIIGKEKEAVYQERFEADFLIHSVIFYRAESRRYRSERSAATYVKLVNKRLTEEKERVARCLMPITVPKILDVVKEELVIKHVTKDWLDLEDSGVRLLVKERQTEDLRAIYQLLDELKIDVAITDLFNCVSKQLLLPAASTKVKETDPVVRIQSLLDLKDECDKLGRELFSDHVAFHSAVSSGFMGMLSNDDKAAEYLSLYIDSKLKCKVKGETEEAESEADAVLERCIQLFRLLPEKDLFERYYLQHLAKRLIFNKSDSLDTEKNVVLKLRRECGYSFTNKMEVMLKDMALSDEMMTEFTEHTDVEVKVRVLTSSSWPIISEPPCALPSKVRIAYDAFYAFYLQRNSGRKLTLQTQLGTADIKAIFGKQSYTLQVSTHQMCILMLFNQSSEYSFEEIKTQTSIGKKALERALQSMAMGKIGQRVLVKRPPGKEMVASDRFSVNETFTSNLRRVKIQTVTAKVESESEQRNTRSKNDTDRRYEIDAAIVRVMKANNKMEHNFLFTKVTETVQARFLPAPSLIKSRIEHLIEREYIARLASDNRVYCYVA